jgi:hypothetical protein
MFLGPPGNAGVLRGTACGLAGSGGKLDLGATQFPAASVALGTVGAALSFAALVAFRVSGPWPCGL